jgi:hypothetical protein
VQKENHLEALAIKTRTTGPNSIGVALTKNAIRELYVKMGKLDKAQDSSSMWTVFEMVIKPSVQQGRRIWVLMICFRGKQL